MNNFTTALEEAQREWMDIDGVIAVGQGKADGQDCIVVHIHRMTPAIEDSIPEAFRGIPVRFEKTGGEVRIQ
jgi:hypothetical protein